MSHKNQGILCILSAAFFFALMNLFVRLSGDVPTIQKSFFRNAIAAIIAVIMLVRMPEKPWITQLPLGDLLLRSIFGTIGVLFNFYAIDHINIADASMLNKLSPFFAMIFSYIILKEKPNRFEWGMLAIAFLGALFVVKPSFQLRSLPAFLGLCSGAAAGIAYTYVRKAGTRGVKGPVIVFFFSAFSCLVTLPYLLFHYSPMTTRSLCMLLLAGCSAAGGQISITKAYTLAPAKEISVFDYAQILFAALLGMLFLGQVPDVWSLIGYGIILSAAIGKWYYTNFRLTSM
jgi:drug/metabolite transporter (DMT)-like permease